MYLHKLLKVELAAHMGEDLENQVTVGIGSPDPEATQSTIVLNHKGYGPKRFDSVSEFVASRYELTTWKGRMGRFDDCRFIKVEDFSLDSCFSLLLLIEELDGPPLSRLPNFDRQAWINYVTAWEKGQYLDRDPESSVGCLFTMFGHTAFPTSHQTAKEGLEDSLQFLGEILNQCADPRQGVTRYPSVHYQRAMARLPIERQMYQVALRRGIKFQLLLPLTGTDNRTLVDALAIREGNASGIVKILARMDQSNSWTKRGFGALAIYRPFEAGSGNDMTLSVDPCIGTSLEEMWKELEVLENQRWNGERPTDNPRPLFSYQQGKLKSAAPNQPWYDEGGRYTILGAPKSIESRKELGSRLNWHDDVLPLLWKVYFLNIVNKLVNFEKQGATTNKLITIAKWNMPEAGATDPSGSSANHPDYCDIHYLLPQTPSFQGWLALNTTQTGESGIISPSELPTKDAVEIVPFSGGYAVAHDEGVTLFCDSIAVHGKAGEPNGAEKKSGNQAESLAKRLADQAGSMATAIDAYEAFRRDYADKLAAWIAILNQKEKPGASADDAKFSIAMPKIEEWQATILDAKAAMLDVEKQFGSISSDFQTQRLCDVLRRRWGLQERRDEVRSLIDRLDELMRSRINARSEHRRKNFGGLLSAAAVAFTLKQIWEPIKDKISMNMYEWQLQLYVNKPPDLDELKYQAELMDRLEIVTLIIVIGGFFLGWMLFKRYDLKASHSE